MLACLFSIVPVPGHMYLGYQQEGLELMTLFFFLIDWMRILFMFVIPVIWFFSMFDALSKAGERLGQRGQTKDIPSEFIAGTDFCRFENTRVRPGDYWNVNDFR